MFSKVSYTWQLMGASWQVLKQDRKMLIFPLLSFVCCVAVLASFALPIILTDSWHPPGGEATAGAQVAYYGVLFLFYLCTYFVVTFFNAALIACAVKRMQGGDPTVGDGLRAATARLPLIVGWAFLAATVGLVLRIIEDRSEKVGRLVAGLLGIAWSLATFLAVPVLVLEGKGPVAALKESSSLLKQTWGEQVIGGFSFGVLFFLLALPGVALVLIGFVLGPTAGWVVGGLAAAAGALYLLIAGLVQSAMEGIFRAALYLYARERRAPGAFGRDMLSSAMQPRG
jgi:hypothetical protein